MKSDEIASEILSLLRSQYPNLDDYHTVLGVKRMVKYFEKLNKVNEDNLIFLLPYDEHIQVQNLNEIRDVIKRELVRKEKNEYMRGVLATIDLIEFRVHSICD